MPSKYFFVCVQLDWQRVKKTSFALPFLSKILIITFIYNKVLNIIRYNKFINKSLIFNNKLTATFFSLLYKTKIQNLDANFLKLGCQLSKTWMPTFLRGGSFV